MGYSNRQILGRPTAAARLIPAGTAPFNKSSPWAPRAEARPPTPTGATPMLSTHDPMALPRCSSGTLDFISVFYSVSTDMAQAPAAANTTMKKPRAVETEKPIRPTP